MEIPSAKPLAARIGIATGIVVVGDLIGEGASQEQAVVGETPNLAARLLALAAPDTVVVAADDKAHPRSSVRVRGSRRARTERDIRSRSGCGGSSRPRPRGPVSKRSTRQA